MGFGLFSGLLGLFSAFRRRLVKFTIYGRKPKRLRRDDFFGAGPLRVFRGLLGHFKQIRSDRFLSKVPGLLGWWLVQPFFKNFGLDCNG